jgi:hypothetical protein
MPVKIRLADLPPDLLAAELPRLSEKEFTTLVIDFAHKHGWRVAHFRPAMTKGGRWVTAVQGDGKGFPDLVLVRGHVLLFAELKVGRNKCTDEQEDWLMAIGQTNSGALVWHPEWWPEIERILRG